MKLKTLGLALALALTATCQAWAITGYSWIHDNWLFIDPPLYVTNQSGKAVHLV